MHGSLGSYWKVTVGDSGDMSISKSKRTNGNINRNFRHPVCTYKLKPTLLDHDLRASICTCMWWIREPLSGERKDDFRTAYSLRNKVCAIVSLFQLARQVNLDLSTSLSRFTWSINDIVANGRTQPNRRMSLRTA